MHCWANWRNPTSEEQYEDIQRFCYTQFDDSRVVNNFSGYGYWNRTLWGAGSIPIVEVYLQFIQITKNKYFCSKWRMLIFLILT